MINDGKSLEVNIRVEDPGAFNMPWTARSTWRRVHPGLLIEDLCEPNNVFFFGYDVTPLPTANTPDFFILKIFISGRHSAKTHGIACLATSGLTAIPLRRPRQDNPKTFRVRSSPRIENRRKNAIVCVGSEASWGLRTRKTRHRCPSLC